MSSMSRSPALEPATAATPTELTPEETDLLAEVATLYYQENLTQAEIGKRIKTSRSTVSRLLREARAAGIVHISINHPWTRDSLLESELGDKFNLREVRVLQSSVLNPDDTLDGMGRLAARYLQTVIKKDMVLGVSYGRSIAATIRNLEPQRKETFTVVQILGALGSDNPLYEGADLARDLAGKYGATYRYLYAPLVVENARIRDLYFQEPLVRDVLNVGRQADVVLIGIGSLEARASELIWRGYLLESDLARLREEGAVGNICAQFFNLHGDVLDTPFNERSISVGLNALKTTDTVIAVAGGASKVQPILGALRGKFIKVLVTDSEAAKGILQTPG